jgi:hypothetical protein
VISPLLANIYLHRLDRCWQTREHGVLVRYADDGVPRTLCTVRCGGGRKQHQSANRRAEPGASRRPDPNSANLSQFEDT